MQTFKYDCVYIMYTMSVRIYQLKDSDIEIVHSQNYLAARVGGREIIIYAEE